MTDAGARSAAVSGRLLSLDLFRGATIAGMILVNNPGDWGSVYWPLLHAPWHGWTPTDLIFPFFLFIVGVSLTLSRRIGWKPALSRARLQPAEIARHPGLRHAEVAGERLTRRLPHIARRAGALGACLSGAGSAIVAFVDTMAGIARVEAALLAVAADRDLPGRVEVVSPRNTGATIVGRA